MGRTDRSSECVVFHQVSEPQFPPNRKWKKQPLRLASLCIKSFNFVVKLHFHKAKNLQNSGKVKGKKEVEKRATTLL